MGRLCYQEARGHREGTAEDTVQLQLWRVSVFVFLVSARPFVCGLPAAMKRRESSGVWGAREGVTALGSRPLSDSGEGPQDKCRVTVTTARFCTGESHIRPFIPQGGGA